MEFFCERVWGAYTWRGLFSEFYGIFQEVSLKSLKSFEQFLKLKLKIPLSIVSYMKLITKYLTGLHNVRPGMVAHKCTLNSK